MAHIQKNDVWELTTDSQAIVKVWYKFNEGDQERLLDSFTGATSKIYGPYVDDVLIRVEVIEGTYTFDIFTGSTLDEVSLSEILKG